MFESVNPKCIQCECVESVLWRPHENGHICFSCFEENHKTVVSKTEPDESNTDEKQRVRKSTRSTRYKSKASSASGSLVSSAASSVGGNGSTATSSNGTVPAVGTKAVPKGRSRRNIFKKNPVKTPTAAATTTSVESLFYNGSYIQIGDIVSLVDSNDDVYYAQVRGLLIDSYCEKSAFLTWLIPTTCSPPPNQRFDASSYLIGPDEDFARKLSCLEFVMHAPSNYYHNKSMPYPPPDIENHSRVTEGGFIWTNIADGPIL